MARRYRGLRDEHGNKAVFVVGDDGVEKLLRPDIGRLGYDWGKANDGAKRLAVALLSEVITGDDERIVRIYVRFAHRTTATWTGASWSIDAAAIERTVDDIERIERETAQTRRMVALAPAPVANEGGGGVSWTRRDMPRPNLPGRK